MNKHQKLQIAKYFNMNLATGDEPDIDLGDVEECPECDGYGETTCRCFAGELRWPVDETDTCCRCNGWGWIYSDGSRHDDELDDQERHDLIALVHTKESPILTPPGMADWEWQQCLAIGKAIDIILKPTPKQQRLAGLNLEEVK